MSGSLSQNPMVRSPKLLSPSSWVPESQVPGSQIPGLRVLGLMVPGSKVSESQGLGSQGPRSQALILDNAETNRLHVYCLISCVIYGLFIFFSFFMQNLILRYTCKYCFQHVLKFSFCNLRFLKALRT